MSHTSSTLSNKLLFLLTTSISFHRLRPPPKPGPLRWGAVAFRLVPAVMVAAAAAGSRAQAAAAAAVRSHHDMAVEAPVALPVVDVERTRSFLVHQRLGFIHDSKC